MQGYNVNPPGAVLMRVVSQEGIVPADAGRRPASRGLRLGGEPAVVSRIFASWNPLISWLRQLDALRSVA